MQGIHCDPSGHYVATYPNLGDVTVIAFQRPAWSSLTRARRLRPHNLITRLCLDGRHMITLISLLWSSSPHSAFASPGVQRRTLQSRCLSERLGCRTRGPG